MTRLTEKDALGKVTRLQGHGVYGGEEIVKEVEKFITDYVSFTDAYALPIALWIMATYVFPSFDAFPYLCITADTKRSGKTRLAEMIGFSCSNPRSFAAMTPSTMFNIIEQEHPTVIFDEAEELSGESAGAMRSVLNVGYRKGSRIPRMVGQGNVKEFDTYCPKIFILIGDVYDTLRDRSIIVRMKRSDTPTRFVYELVKSRGQELRDNISSMMNENISLISQNFMDHKGMGFLTDRDEEIWMPLFVMAETFCPNRIKDLEKIAVDMATEKTVAKRRYVDLGESEDAAQEEEYAIRLLGDLLSVMEGKAISSTEAVEKLRGIPTAPWRKFRGDGITMHNIADMLSRFGVRPTSVRSGKKVFKGYKVDSVRLAVRKHVGLKS